MQTRPFYSALVHLNDFYGIVMGEDQFENVGLHAWDHIGNKNNRTYVFEGEIVDNQLELPCNADIIEAVLHCGESYTSTDGISNDNADMFNGSIENEIEANKVTTEFLYESGRFVDYERNGNKLYFKVGGTVRVIYKGVFVDDTGLPFLNFKEVDAISKYCAFVHLQKQAMITKDQAMAQIAMMMRQQWQFSVEDARSPIYLNQNDMDNLLNVKSSWDRKRFGLSFKVIR